MNARLAILALLLAGGLSVRGAEGFTVGGRLTADDGVTVLTSGAFRLTAGLATNLTAAAVSTATVDVRTNGAGDYLTTLPLDPAPLFETTDTVYLRQSFADPSGKCVATLPAQRIGSAPYALHTTSAGRLARTTVDAGQLSVTGGAHCAMVIVTNTLTTTGALVVTGALEVACGEPVVHVTRLAVRTCGTSWRSPDAWSEQAAVGGSCTFEIVPDTEGLLELEIVAADSSAAARIVRTAAGRSEVLLDSADTSSAAGTRRLTVPVRTGEELSVSVTGDEVRVRWRIIGFGIRRGRKS